MNVKDYHLQYINAGKELFTLKDGSKKPKGLWRDAAAIEAGSCKNAGWRLSQSDVVIDVDAHKDGVFDTWLQLKEKYNLPEPTVRTPKGGFHLYLRVPDGVNIKNDNTGKWCGCEGIDIKSYGGYVVVAGSTTVANSDDNTVDGVYDWYDLFGGFEQLDCPEALLAILPKAKNTTIKSKKNSSDSDCGDDSCDNNDNDSWLEAGDFETKEEDAKKWLDLLDPDCSNDDWVKYGMILSRCRLFNGFALWNEWSQRGKKYKQNDCEKRWKSFTNNRDYNDLIKIGSLIHDAKQVSKQNIINKVDGYISKFDALDNRLGFENLCAEISKDKTLSKIDLDILSKQAKSAAKKITGATLSAAAIKDLIVKKSSVTSQSNDDNDKFADWCNQWVYVTHNNEFLELNTRCRYSQSAFNQKVGYLIPASEKGVKVSASKYVADWGLLQNVTFCQYMPSIKEQLFSINGVNYANMFNYQTLPTAAVDYTSEGLQAIERIKNHIKLIFYGDDEYNIIMQWLAWQRQRVGEKILWCPLIQGIEGVGKSFFARLLEELLGDQNVNEVSPRETISQFNGWAVGACVNVLSELRIVGYNRHEAVNALKPLITDKRIMVNEKGVKPYQAYNCTNYICTTNYKDAIPLDGNDRRWWVNFVDFKSIEDFEAKIGYSESIYFAELFTGLSLHSAEIIKFFDEYDITKEFEALKRAPQTIDKQMMVATENQNVDAYDEAAELIAIGGRYYNADWLSSSDFFTDLMIRCDDVILSNIEKSKLLKKLGFTFFKQIRINNDRKKIWVSKKYTHDEIKNEILNAPPF